MPNKGIKTLKTGHRKAMGMTDEHKEIVPAPSEMQEKNSAADSLDLNLSKDNALKDIPDNVIRKAWFTMAHLLLQDGARVACMGCGDGEMAYTMAVLNPEIEFIGIDSEKKAINKTKKLPALPNLSFQHADITKSANVEEGSLDAVINSFVLHEIYSDSHYNDREVAKALDYQFTLLKEDGLLFIRDYAQRHAGEYVVMEMPDEKSTSKNIEDLSEADLLLWYSENARSEESAGCNGFFLEELPPRFPKTRLFRLPYKWAYEFIIRKDRRRGLKATLHKEYTFYTEREFRKGLRAMGARSLYAAPHWDEALISKNFEGRFRLYDDNGKSLGPPPTSFVLLAQKMRERDSLILRERRPSQKETKELHIESMRNDATGELVDIATRNRDTTDILPYRVTPEGGLKIFVHESLPRGIVNAVPRKGKDIDGKRWSGHMLEAISVPTDIVHTIEQGERKESLKFSQKYLGLKPVADTTLETGRSYYPAPDYIDELIHTRYMRIAEQNHTTIKPKAVMNDIRGFSTQGSIKELDAQHVLDAISVGIVPNANLELQILELFERLNIKAEAWDETPLMLEESEPELMLDGKLLMKLKAEKDKRFKKSRGRAHQIRGVQSIFVDEGWVQGGVSGIGSRDLEFVIPEEGTINKAVVIPLTKRDEDVLVGMQVDYHPVPQRHEGNGVMMRAPSVNLPKEVTNIYQAKKYVAEQFKVKPEEVWRLGEAYFSHVGMTPQRIFPFAIASKGKRAAPQGGPIEYAPLAYIGDLFAYVDDFKGDGYTLGRIKKVMMRMQGSNSEHGMKHAAGAKAFGMRAGQDTVTTTSSIQGLSGGGSSSTTNATSNSESSAPREKRSSSDMSEYLRDLHIK